MIFTVIIKKSLRNFNGSILRFESGGIEYAVLGIGINVKTPENGFPGEIKDIASEIFDNNSLLLEDIRSITFSTNTKVFGIITQTLIRNYFYQNIKEGHCLLTKKYKLFRR